MTRAPPDRDEPQRRFPAASRPKCKKCAATAQPLSPDHYGKSQAPMKQQLLVASSVASRYRACARNSGERCTRFRQLERRETSRGDIKKSDSGRNRSARRRLRANRWTDMDCCSAGGMRFAFWHAVVCCCTLGGGSYVTHQRFSLPSAASQASLAANGPRAVRSIIGARSAFAGDRARFATDIASARATAHSG